VYNELYKDVQELEKRMGKMTISQKVEQKENAWSNTKIRQPRDYTMFGDGKHRDLKNLVSHSFGIRDSEEVRANETDFEVKIAKKLNQITKDKEDLEEILIN